MKRLNIFVDETGEFGYGKGASELYGVSFTFHEQSDDLSAEISKLNKQLEYIGYTDMIHMADLIMRRGDYSKFDIKKRKRIFNAIYQFARRVPVKYHTIILDKRYVDGNGVLKQQLSYEIEKLIVDHANYFSKFDSIVLYYDNGQSGLGKIFDSAFVQFENYDHRVYFDHCEKRLFQVSDMLTYIDKYDYKYKHKLPPTKSERYFFTTEELRKILKSLEKKRFKH